MNPAVKKERVERILVALNSAGPSTLDDFKKQAAAAFEKDMQPVCNAVVAALHAGDLKALQGLRALLPHLLEEVNRAPALADLLAHQLGKALLDGLNAKPEATL